MSRKEKQEIETLNEQLDHYIRELDRANARNRCDQEYITMLKKLLDEEKARYVALLESHIRMMERVAGIEALDKKQTQTETKYFTPDDVRRMTVKDVRDNYQAIMDSMKKWK